ncbi:crotonobetainyl-CoA:carnitine CoA-transferase CaiB-like acyl-CoA transferase [Plasticicumulans lactativorans]|uniref:Crotonobetainyl-CoA:carnitine CoA-transferase CaiB-like acyl-CoA transferase n=1 Tax=Plasticicumulans lactativorans TaxID=1133106 RepID=A0A4R2L3R1_9GAMM|nr:CaiB/BaiF CoA-transferase family protein [Plasticicumulans lactativorans]TCO81033.1 crotonobetainyl-CoA:carnitine CoA-transferase CaiB-like acyl-CoA transferase [Plasticicumulans lactativorans]
MSGALSHIRVLDLSRVLAGPWAGQILADLGAEVIKVERPGVGDDTRGWGPPYARDAAGQDTGEAAYYLCANRGKRSVTVDIAKPEGQRLVRELAAHCDVLIENYKVGGLARYGLDYASLSAGHPGLIYCSVTGFGQTGPYRDLPGYDFMVQGLGGLMSITGEPDGVPGGGPMKVGVALADVMTGLYATIGVLAALAHRDQTGVGQHIDMALLDVQVAVLANQAMNYLTTGVAPQRLGNAHPNIVPYQTFAAADGHLILAVGNDAQFARFCEVAGVAELARDPRFATNRARVAHRAELVPLLAARMALKPRDAWLAELGRVNVPCGPINTLDQVFADPQVQHRGLRVDLPHPLAGSVPGVGSPLKLSATPVEYGGAPPTLGQHTDSVLGELLGYPRDAIERLRAHGVV